DHIDGQNLHLPKPLAFAHRRWTLRRAAAFARFFNDFEDDARLTKRAQQTRQRHLRHRYWRHGLLRRWRRRRWRFEAERVAIDDRGIRVAISVGPKTLAAEANEQRGTGEALQTSRLHRRIIYRLCCRTPPFPFGFGRILPLRAPVRITGGGLRWR